MGMLGSRYSLCACATDTSPLALVVVLKMEESAVDTFCRTLLEFR